MYSNRKNEGRGKLEYPIMRYSNKVEISISVQIWKFFSKSISVFFLDISNNFN